METPAPSVYADAFQVFAATRRRRTRLRRVLVGLVFGALLLVAGLGGPLWWHFRQLDERRAWERELGEYVGLHYTPTAWSYEVYYSGWVPSAVAAWYQEKSKAVTGMDFGKLGGRTLPPDLAEKLIESSWPNLRSLNRVDGCCWDGRRWVLPQTGGVGELKLNDLGIYDDALAVLPVYPVLRGLDLSGNPLGDRVGAYVAGLPNLVSVSLTETNVTDQTLAALAACPHLESLFLRGTAVRGGGLLHLRGLNRLRTLDLRLTPLVDEHLRHMPALPALTTLDLSGTKIDGAGLAWEWEAAVGVLNLGDTSLRDEYLAHLRRFKALWSLTLSGTAVRGSGLEHLRELPKLSALNLSRTAVDDDGVRRLAAGTCPALSEVLLVETRITDTAAVELRKLSALQMLAVSDTRVGDAFVATLAGHPTLSSLSLANTRVTDACVPSLLALPGLRFLDVRGTRLTEAAVAPLKQRVYFASDRPPPVPPF